MSLSRGRQPKMNGQTKKDAPDIASMMLNLQGGNSTSSAERQTQLVQRLTLGKKSQMANARRGDSPLRELSPVNYGSRFKKLQNSVQRPARQRGNLDGSQDLSQKVSEANMFSNTSFGGKTKADEFQIKIQGALGQGLKKQMSATTAKGKARATSNKALTIQTQQAKERAKGWNNHHSPSKAALFKDDPYDIQNKMATTLKRIND